LYTKINIDKGLAFLVLCTLRYCRGVCRMVGNAVWSDRASNDHTIDTCAVINLEYYERWNVNGEKEHAAGEIR
jgi:hypothetical protein